MMDREKEFREWLRNYNPALFKRVEKDACSYNELIAHQIAKTAFNAALDLMDEETCEWSLTEDWESEHWQSGCGKEWEFMNDGPVENGVKYCHNCGRKVVIASPESEG